MSALACQSVPQSYGWIVGNSEVDRKLRSMSAKSSIHSPTVTSVLTKSCTLEARRVDRRVEKACISPFVGSGWGTASSVNARSEGERVCRTALHHHSLLLMAVMDAEDQLLRDLPL